MSEKPFSCAQIGVPVCMKYERENLALLRSQFKECSNVFYEAIILAMESRGIPRKLMDPGDVKVELHSDGIGFDATMNVPICGDVAKEPK